MAAHFGFILRMLVGIPLPDTAGDPIKDDGPTMVPMKMKFNLFNAIEKQSAEADCFFCGDPMLFPFQKKSGKSEMIPSTSIFFSDCICFLLLTVQVNTFIP